MSAHELGFIRKYIFSTDHKVIGIQYALTSLTFLFLGLSLMLLMRWQLANPGQPVPVVGGALEKLLGEPAGEGKISADLYNSFGAMHGTIMIFLGIVPLVFGAFGNYVVPLQVGAVDMAFPKLNMLSYFLYLLGGIIMLVSFFVPGGAAQAGWTSYPPLATIIPTDGQTYWLVAMLFLITSSLLGSINIIVTVIQLRVPGLTWMRLPFFVWSQFVTAFLLLLAFPPLEAGAILQLMDRLAGTSFFMPHGLILSGQPATGLSGGGSPLLWQHLFWFLGHPEVYVLILPAMGIVTEVIANNTRKPIWGYRALVGSVLAIGFLSMVVWAHHMYVTGMGAGISMFFQTTTTIISIPSVIIMTCLMLSLWGGSIRFTVPMMFAIAFLPMFGIGGLTGLPLAFTMSDVALHDSYYIIGHFHYVVAPGTIFAVFAGVYYWFPKVTGRHMNRALGYLHFWGSLVSMNLIFFPMLVQGIGGMGRRMSDGGYIYSAAHPANEGVIGALSDTIMHLNVVIACSALSLAAFQLPFIFNFFYSAFAGRRVESDNPWQATTLEWQTPTPPPHGNFANEMFVYREPYAYSLAHSTHPSTSTAESSAAVSEFLDFEPQNQPIAATRTSRMPVKQVAAV
ncbi:MAG TPA: cbb3-type cytochrome c oxidase subunit I [Pirellulales bacterium]|nr:cbb3-type cytochrome c oxidase subunit I [Pirellulales bacterium]